MKPCLTVAAARRRAVMAAILLGGLPVAGWAKGGALPALAGPDRQRLEQALGPGVVGAPVSMPAVDPETLLAPEHGSRTFRLLAGKDQGKDELHSLAAGQKSGWDYRVGDAEILRLAREPDGSIVLAGVEDRQENVATRYDPPKPLLMKGAAAGQQFTVHMGVKVFDAKQPDRLRHTGTMDVTADYLGAFRVKVPAGSFDAVLIRYSANGKIGPARLDNRQYAFYAPGVGLVASVEAREVSALAVYHSTEQAAKVLAAKAD